MTVKVWVGSPAIAAALGIAIVLLASSCGTSTSLASRPTPSVVASATHTTPPPPASPPPGGPVPAQLLGDWFLGPAVTVVADGASACPSPPTAANCFTQLNLTATEYHVSLVQTPTAAGNVVVNSDEIDFFNGGNCGLQLPDGVGRYKWTITGGVLQMTLLDQDPCGRDPILAQQWSRTH